MIYVDDRAGSVDLVEPLRAQGLDVDATRLDFGDIAFEGRGEGGTPVTIGIEYKHLGELVTALRTNRLVGHQLPGMQAEYDFCYLFIEGTLRWHQTTGQLQRASKYTRRLQPLGMTINELLKRLFVLHLRRGVIPWWTTTQTQTVQAIFALYRTWTDKDLDQHTSHVAIYQAPTTVPVSATRVCLSSLPGVGQRVSLAAERAFGSIAKAILGTVDEWAKLEITDAHGHVKHLGHVKAQRIVDFCHGADHA